MKIEIMFSTAEIYTLDKNPLSWGAGDSGLDAGLMNGVEVLTLGMDFIEWEAGCHFAYIMGDRDEV